MTTGIEVKYRQRPSLFYTNEKRKEGSRRTATKTPNKYKPENCLVIHIITRSSMGLACAQLWNMSEKKL